MQKFIESWLDNDDQQLSEQKLRLEIEKQIRHRLSAMEKGFTVYRQDLLGWPEIEETKGRDRPSPQGLD